MSPEELRAAAAKVRSFMYARTVTTGTVLAAYLRRDGLPASGTAFQCAKAALDAGQSFEEAVALARELTEVSEGVRSATEPASRLVDIGTSRSGTVRDSGQASTVTRSATPKGVIHLDWYPKSYGPGDIDGTGALNLLGAPSVNLVDLLVRETAQNSWDAKFGDSPLRFGVHLRTLTEEQRQLMTRSVFRDGGDRLTLAASLAKTPLRVLEISDHGTCGLNGPTRNDLHIAAGVPRNYVDLILNVGSPPDRLGAGTYGFGKTVAYTSSHARTVIFWSRSREDGMIEERLVASGIGESFDLDGRRYTGRHWWGRNADQGVEPLRGEAARDLAHALFTSRYGVGETGTAILIIDPVLDERGPKHHMEALREAVLTHLWPKLVEDPGRRRMQITLQLEGEPFPIPDPTSVPVLAPFVECLKSVRATQRGESPAPLLPIAIREVATQRPAALVGHLALARGPIGAGPDLSFATVAHHVCLMRHDAELVVTYREFPVADTDGFQWAGVFKPVAAMDRHFADAEPPAHDDWQPALLRRPAHTYVNQASVRIRDMVRDYLRPVEPPPAPSGPAPSAAPLADRLATLAGTAVGSRPTLRASTQRPGRPQRRQPQAEVVSYSEISWIGNRRHLAVAVQLKRESPGPALVSAAVSVGIEGGLREPNQELVRLLGWADEPGGELFDDRESCMLPRGRRAWLAIEARADLVVDVQLRAELL